VDKSIDTEEMGEEIGARLREELDYALEAAHMALYRAILADEPTIHVPDVLPDLSTQRLLTMTWLEGRPILDFKTSDQETRNRLSETLFAAWWRPFSRYAVIHGDPHLGNYSVREDLGLNLLDFGCVRTFRPEFVDGVIGLYRGLKNGNPDETVAAYETWGFKNLSNELIDVLNIWAKFIYGPMLDDRVRSIADGVAPGDYGRKEAFAVHGKLRELGPVKPPREFVFMDRAAIGLGAVFLHLGAEMNFHDLFNEAIEGSTIDTLRAHQEKALTAANVPLPL
jgi:predicted unusual protein kinase regulating ubiquinone biosynthesis (AarF/ABC1/UbiB family)